MIGLMDWIVLASFAKLVGRVCFSMGLLGKTSGKWELFESGSNLDPKDSIKKGGCFTKQWDQGLWVRNSHILKPPAFGGVARNWKASLPTAAVDA